jgi:hypothetical protein
MKTVTKHTNLVSVIKMYGWGKMEAKGQIEKTMKLKGVMLHPKIIEILDQLLAAQCQTFSEYARNLIIQDLDKRSVFSTRLFNHNPMKEASTP